MLKKNKGDVEIVFEVGGISTPDIFVDEDAIVLEDKIG